MFIASFTLLLNNGERESYRIVTEKSQEQWENAPYDIFYKSKLAQGVAEAQAKGKKEFFLDENQKFVILKWIQNEKYCKYFPFSSNGAVRHENIREIDLTLKECDIAVRKYSISPKYKEPVRARVACLSPNGIVSYQTIELFYSYDDRQYGILSNALAEYEKRFGRLLMQITRRNASSKDDLFGNGYTYQEDTVLSRWGYIAQEEKMRTAERQAILRYLIDNEITTKSEIAEILNHFIDTRARCIWACRIWAQDLEYVLEYNQENERIIKVKKYY